MRVARLICSFYIIIFLVNFSSGYCASFITDTVVNPVNFKFYDTTKAQMRFAIYTDGEGLQQDNPNGLVQTEIYFSWPGINTPIKKFKDKEGNETAHLYVLRNFVLPNLQINKIEDKLKYLPLIKSNDRFYVSTFDLIQYAHLTNYVKLNIFTVGFKRQNRIYLDATVNHVNTLAVDSLTNNKFSLNSLGIGVNLRYQTN
jgi:hypothetical protein